MSVCASVYLCLCVFISVARYVLYIDVARCVCISVVRCVCNTVAWCVYISVC